MNVSRMKKPELIIELERRLLPTNGLKEELKLRLTEAIENENCGNEVEQADIENKVMEDDVKEDTFRIQSIENDDQESQEMEDTEILEKQDNSEVSPTNEIEDVKEIKNETLNDDEIIIGADQSTIITVEDMIKMKTYNEIENDSMVVNINEYDVENEDDYSSSNSQVNDDDNVDRVQTRIIANNNNREIDNGDHEIIEISEEVVIDDEDNQETDNHTNYNISSSDCTNQQPSSRGQLGNDEMEECDGDVMVMEKKESRKDELSKTSVKTEIWVSNIAEDVKAVELKELFGKYGKVISAKVVMNAKNPSGCCFGCIQLATANDAKACIQNLDQTQFRGNIISITNDISEKTTKEKIIKNVSPVSSSASWGSKKKIANKTGSLTPLQSSTSQSINKSKNDSHDKEKRPPYRDNKPYSGSGGFYKGGKNFQDQGAVDRRGHKQQFENRRMEFSNRCTSATLKPYYKPNTYGSNSYVNNNNRDRDSFSRRDPPPRNNNYNSQYESRYASSGLTSRDRPVRNFDYTEKMKPCYDYRSRPASKYDDYEEYDYRRDTKRSGYDRPSSGFREMDNFYQSSNKRVDLYKRSRPEESDDYLQSAKKRRTDLISSDRSRYYRNIESPKQSSHYQEKNFRKSDYRSRRDDYGSPDYIHTKTERDLYPVRRSMEFSNRREVYDAYSSEKQHSGRSNHYNKDPYIQHATDFGGRSRRY